MAKKEEIVKLRSPFQLNIGVVVFFIIIIYVLFNLFSYFTKKDIAKYQVQPGSIAENHVHQGLIVRDETVVYATADGYVDYYVKNGSKASVTDIVYSLDSVGNISNQLAQYHKNQDISSETMHSIDKEITSFLGSYDSNRFGTSYTFFNNLNSEIIYAVNQIALEEMHDKIQQAIDNNTFSQMTSVSDGIVLYEVDGYEKLTVDELLSSGWDPSSYKKTFLFSNHQIKANEAVYKIINSEEWYVLLPVSEDVAKQMNDKKTCTIRFCKDDFQTTANCAVTKKNGNYYLKLSLKTGMIRYAQERFVDIELVVKSITGLKIPNSSITEKEFFTIPKKYFTEEINSLLVKRVDEESGEESIKTISPTIYFATDDFYYIDSEDIEAGEVILRPESQEVYVVGSHTDALKGVYNINKGYAIFKQINILYQNAEYAIVEKQIAYGIAQYDHIALDASKIKEHELISK